MKFFIKISIITSFIFLISCQSQQKEQDVKGLQTSEGYVDVDGGKIWYRILGGGEKTPVLTMHGGPGGTSRYFYQLDKLSQERPVILFDQLGSGRSRYHEDTTLLKVENFVEQVATLRETLGLEEYFTLGHSWGSALQLEYYLKYPEGIKGMVFSSPYVSTPIWTADADTLILSLPDSIQRAIAVSEESGDFESDLYQNANTYFLKNFGLRTTRKTHPLDTADAPFNAFMYNYMWGPSEFTATGTLKNFDRFESLSEIKVPTLFVTGEFDEARPATVRTFQQKVLGSEFVVIAGAGHATLHDNGIEYNKEVGDFLRSID